MDFDWFWIFSIIVCDYARRMTVSDQETRSESALGSRVDDTSSEVKLCDRVSDQIWFCVQMIYVHHTGLSKANIENFVKKSIKWFWNCDWILLLSRIYSYSKAKRELGFLNSKDKLYCPTKRYVFEIVVWNLMIFRSSHLAFVFFWNLGARRGIL